MGEFKVVAYKRGILLGVIFLVIMAALVIFVSSVETDEFGVKFTVIVCALFLSIVLFQFIFRNDGLYLYENGLRAVRFGRVREIYYHEIIYFTVVRKWRLRSINPMFISTSHAPYIRMRLTDESLWDSFFEADNHALQMLAQHISYVE